MINSTFPTAAAGAGRQVPYYYVARTPTRAAESGAPESCTGAKEKAHGTALGSLHLHIQAIGYCGLVGPSFIKPPSCRSARYARLTRHARRAGVLGLFGLFGPLASLSVFYLSLSLSPPYRFSPSASLSRMLFPSNFCVIKREARRTCCGVAGHAGCGGRAEQGFGPADRTILDAI